MINWMENAPDGVGSLFFDEPEIAFLCDMCGSEIYEGERYYEIGSRERELRVCEDCVYRREAEKED
jgi:ribosome-binding protein aMBF1 (putative translation factor)